MNAYTAFSFLVGLGHDVKLVPKGIKNSKVFEMAVKEGRLIISRDENFLNDSLYPSLGILEFGC